MEREPICIKMNPNLWIDVKVYCAKKGITYSDFIETLVKEKLKKLK